MPGSRKSKKDAKDIGGVVAAVTKQSAHKSSNNTTKGFASDASSPTIQSPEVRPIATPSSTGYPEASPQLAAITATSFAPSSAPQITNEWSRGSPALGGSPGNLISIMGESPPTLPSSYEDPQSLQGWPSPRAQPSNLPLSISPPMQGRRPLSFQMDQASSAAEGQGYSAAGVRRSSLQTHIAQSRAGRNPPLPHQAQTHFYGAPDIDFGLDTNGGLKAGQRGYYFGFDTLPVSYAGNASGTEKVVIAGYEGGLEIYSVTKRGVEPLTRLKGLRGGVYDAKVLPHLGSDGSDSAPLIALVVHGPKLPSSLPEIVVQSAQGDVRLDGQVDKTNSSRGGMSRKEETGIATSASIDAYQTSVEVYSLKTGKIVSVLLAAPEVKLKTAVDSPIFQPPTPTANLHIQAHGSHVVIASGFTGECWVFRHVVTAGRASASFVCLAKLWTTLQQPLRKELGPEDAQGQILPALSSAKTPIVALKGRWLAYCPAQPSSHIALRAEVLVPIEGKGPGLASLTPPHVPPVSSELDIPSSESVMNKIVRDATQELISGAKWVSQQGWQAFNNYWNGPSPSPTSRSPPSTQRWSGAYSSSRQENNNNFPPTHGSASPMVVKEPGLVSLLDVLELPYSAGLHHLATFPAPLGCSFLSFSPAGLSLLTVSTKGDVQTVWDLMRVQYTKGASLQTASLPGVPSGSRVRKVAHFTRMTVARIVDIAWVKPNGERLAMVSERGTVHLMDIPSAAFTWPPPRRRIQSPTSTTKAAPPEGTASTVSSYAQGALSSAFDAARPLIARSRRSSSNVAQSTGASIVDHASQGGKMLAAGISHSLGRTGNAINQLRHTGEMKVSLPLGDMTPGSSCVTFLTGRRQHSLFALGAGVVRSFAPKSRGAFAGRQKARGPRLGRYVEFKVAALPNDTIAPAVKQFLEPDEFLDFSDENDGADNTLVLDARVKNHLPLAVDFDSSIPQAEIESSAPYQPFHTDRRVALYERKQQLGISHGKDHDAQSSVSDLLAETAISGKPKAATASRKQKEQRAVLATASTAAWVFGGPMESTLVNTGVPLLSEEEFFNIHADDTRALPPSAMERVLQHVGEDAQIVVTTRRRRGGGRSTDPDEEGFFEDDCEVLDFADQRV